MIRYSKFFFCNFERFWPDVVIFVHNRPQSPPPSYKTLPSTFLIKSNPMQSHILSIRKNLSIMPNFINNLCCQVLVTIENLKKLELCRQIIQYCLTFSCQFIQSEDFHYMIYVISLLHKLRQNKRFHVFKPIIDYRLSCWSASSIKNAKSPWKNKNDQFQKLFKWRNDRSE